LTDKNYESSFFDELVLFCENNKIELNVLSDLASFLSGTTTVENFDGVPFVVHKQLTQSTCALILKRFFDICLSGLGLVFLSPLFLIVSIVIKCVSPHGPVFYLQERVGLNGKAFKMIKLRTMYPDAESRTGPVLVDEKGDSRYIRGGGFLRRYSIDELPQLFNVIKGEMSLVGPRPERPFFVEKYTKTNPNFLLRHQIRGGLTGWAQINGRSVLTRRPEHKLKYDLYYIKRWSLVLDIKIMIKTVSVVLRKEESY
jgi:exopolysaccharide biosynthesis polyprenyl glycosylphosphotransferase